METVWDFNPTREELERVLTRNFAYKEIDELLEVGSDEDRPPKESVPAKEEYVKLCTRIGLKNYFDLAELFSIRGDRELRDKYRVLSLDGRGHQEDGSFIL